ncbi:6-phospho-3-hexuloisomerase [Cohnella terricola]|uniref:6-phospho-3-hexuloisomerase n=1 Tax=Cohnella terricola TaxID=1289167 RepID=A0A559J8R6_9BACL|nr:6-phospho-3-hexuloisomerase [Cohnella terricola]TVX96247.1 6-phospho-3-hexuloisomerase [Cohnella terricola]
MTSPDINQIFSELQRVFALIRKEQTEILMQSILKADRVFVAGAGRSGLMMRAFAMRMMHLGLNVYVVGETTTPNISQGDLLIVGSGSGATGSLVHMAERAKKYQAGVALITIYPESPIGRIADHIVEIAASTPKSEQKAASVSVQPMGSLFEQVLLLYLDWLVMQGMVAKNKDEGQMFARHANLE